MRYLLSILSVFLLISCGTESTPVYTLTTSTNGEGTVSPSSGEFEEGETVTLTSSPNNGWLFDSWSGDGSGTTGTISITMNSDKNVVGNFQRRDYPLTVTVEGEGTVGERIVSQPKTTDYPFETVIELTPIPSDGWRFVEWGGDLSGDEEPIQITIDGEKSVTVTFERTIYLGENGITIMCPYGEVGDIGIVDGVEYEVVDRNLLIQRWEEGRGNFERGVCVSLITNMNEMFNRTPFNQPIGNWDVSNVTDMRSMFSFSQFNQPIGDWDVSNVTRMDFMFSRTPFNQSIGNWDVSNVTHMDFMFSRTPFNQSIGNWDVSSVTSMGSMFFDSPFNQSIGDWNVSNVTNMEYIFWETEFNQTISDWDVSNVTKMTDLFNHTPFNQPIGDWNVSSVTEMEQMFFNSTQFNQPIGEWDVGSVTNMIEMFKDSQFNQNLSNWCVWRITTEPPNFSLDSPLTEENKPVWGTCPD